MILSIIMLPNVIMGAGGVLSMLLIILLATRNIAEAGNATRWSNNLIIGIVPLLIAFFIIVIMKTIEIVGGH